MSDEQNDGQVHTLELAWKDTETFFVDQIVGFSTADGVGRVSLGQLRFQPGNPNPIAVPVANLFATLEGWRRIRNQVDTLVAALDRPSMKLNDPTGAPDGQA